MNAFWRDVRFIRWAAQIIFIGLIAVLIWAIFSNVRNGLQAANIPIGFDFLDAPSGFQLSEGFSADPHKREDTYAHALAIGLINTLRVIVFGLFFSTILGLAVGIARLSSNWLLRTLSIIYIEIIQNTPLLVQMIFLYSGVVLALPPLRNALELPGPSYLSVKGLATPLLVPTASNSLWSVIALAGLAAGYVLWRQRRTQRLATGKQTYAAEAGLGVGLVVLAGSWLLLGLLGNSPYTVSFPRVQGFNYARGEGLILTPEFVAIVVGLVLYTGAFIAEVVRSGIQSVSVGQWEAARAQGFSYFQTLRLIILPQALRVMFPPLTNQYVNLAKNSSIGAAVGFADLFGVARTMQDTVPVVSVIVIVMVVYLSISLLTAFLMNMLNARFQIKTR
jgi:general L-amino acid transport system permease protein